jgi:hypothetical protein
VHERVSAVFTDEEVGEMSHHHFEIVRISDGLAFGHGSISGADDEPEVLGRVDEIIQNSGEILVPIDKNNDGRELEDDGCGDGREATHVFRLHETFKRSLNRAKVFGGSVTMAAACLIGVGRAKDESLDDVFGSAVGILQDNDMDFGAHTDEHASGENCGCGAIDHAPEAILAALKYEEPIRSVIDALGADTEQLDEVYGNFRGYVQEMPHKAAYSGRKVMDRIINAGKVVKKLGGDHRERRIILNTVRGYTVNQRLIREATGGRAQAFAVDIWRLEDIATNLFSEDTTHQSQAYLSELVYTLAIAAVLTRGDLPVYVIQDASSSAAA